MKTVFTNLIFVSLLWFGCGVRPSLNCPPECGCEDKENGFLVNCANKGFKSPINPNDLPANTFELDLSNNEIESIVNNAFKRKNLTKFRKLNLSGNRLQMIAPDAFSGLNKLTRIDLSKNKLSVLNEGVFGKLRNIKNIDLSNNQLFMLNKTQFYGCKNLKTIDLSSNKLTLLPDGLFVTSLHRNVRKIDLDLNPLICDCNLKWLVTWINGRKELNVQGRCDRPYRVKDNKVAKLKDNKMVCDKLDLPVMFFGPQGDQIAFKGDSHAFVCNSSWIPGMQITWYKDNKLITVDPDDKRKHVVIKFDPSKVVISTVLGIKQLTVDDSGYYSCSVTHKGGYRHVSRSHLAIIPSNAKFCRAASTETDKGTFHWHHTAAGGFAFLPCPVGVMSSLINHGRTELMARRNCSLEGVWMGVEAQSCAHANEITRALYDLKQKTVNDTTVAAVSHQLLNISKRAREYSDPLDVVYGAEVVEKLAQVIGRDQLLNENLVDTISNIMETDVTLLQDAQQISKACSSMVIFLDVLATRFPMDLQSDMAFISKNIAVYVVQISQIELDGKMCYVTTGKDSKLKDIDCVPCAYNTSCKKQMLVDTSIYLPRSLFLQIPSDAKFNVKFQFIVYSNSKLFPEITNGSETEKKREVSSSVMSAQFGGIQLTNLSHPVILKFRNHQNGEEPIPVYWDHEGNGQLGSWKMNTDCNKVSSQDNSTITECSQLSNKNFFAIMMNVRKPADTGASGDNLLYLLPFSLELVVFVGAGISILFILTTLIVYTLIRDLRFGRDDAAMLMNHCLALIVTIVVFVTGINQVTNVLVCRSVGVLLHYFLLCSLLWIGCGGICLHRLIRTAIQPEEFNPVLRYYMASWGIPLIICGITIAGNPDNYNVHDYCWLRRHPFYGAFVGPACLIVLIDLIIFLRVFNLINRTYDTEVMSQAEQENEVEIVAEENALVIQQEPLPNDDGTGDIVDKSTLPDKKEMVDHLRGSCVILLVIVISVTLGVMMIRYQQPRALYIALNFLFAVLLVVLGALVFVFYCYRKEKVRLFWRKCCKCWCLSNKQYEIQQETPQTHTYEEISTDKTTADTGNVQEVQFTGDQIHGAKNQLSQGDEDSQSNVSLPYSAVIRIDKQDHVAEKEAEVEPEKAPSVSDKQSCTSAPLPMKYKPRGRLLKHPPGHRHSYTENTLFPPSISEDRRAPLAPPEGTASSVDSSTQLPTDTASNVAPSECHSSVREAADPLNVSRHTNTSCSASEVSIPVEIPSLKRRPPIPGSSSHGSDGAPPLPFKNIRTPVPGVQPVSRPGCDNQDLAHYTIAETPTSGIPRQIPRDHVVVRERYHIPYEPRALSEKPRDHYQILPLPTNRRDHYILQPGLDVGPNPHNQYQVSPDNYQMPDDQIPGQRTYAQNQIPSPTQGQTFYHITRDQTPAQRVHDLYQIARDMPPSPRLYENYQVPHEQIPPQIALERYQVQQDHTTGKRTHDQAQRPLEHSHMLHDPSFGQRPHDNLQVPRDHIPRDQPYDYIPLPADQNPAQIPPHERSTSPCHENERDPVQGARDQNLTNDSAHGPNQEAAERPHDQYAGEGPREQQQAVSPSDKSTTADKRPDVPLDKNGVRTQNAPRGTREQPNGIHVPRRRSRNPYQIARDIHHNLGIETRSSRRSKRVPVEQRTQPQKTYPKDVVSSPGETPKERTPRSSMSSWKEERPKPAQKEWASDLPKTAVFVPVPHLKRTTPEPPRNETSV